METFFLLCAAVLILCIFSNKISNKLGVPSLLIFMLLGMLFGSDGIFKIDFADFAVAEDICTAALVFIMFYGGYSTNWKHARPAAPKALLLSIYGRGYHDGGIGFFVLSLLIEISICRKFSDRFCSKLYRCSGSFFYFSFEKSESCG